MNDIQITMNNEGRIVGIKGYTTPRDLRKQFRELQRVLA